MPGPATRAGYSGKILLRRKVAEVTLAWVEDRAYGVHIAVSPRRAVRAGPSDGERMHVDIVRVTAH